MSLAQEPNIDPMATIARYIEQHADQSLPLKDLAQLAGLSASRLQKRFKSAFGVSPKAYQDAVRMRRFKAELKEGAPVTDAIYAAGFGSVSRLYGEPGRQMGMSPKRYRNQGADEDIAYACRETTMGWLMMAATDQGVCFAEFGDGPDALLVQLQTEFPRANLTASNATQSQELDDWIDALEQHLADKAPRPDLPLDLRGTAFQQQVWHCLLTLHEGETIHYTELAERIGRPRSVRAAASACGKNRIAVLVPCHRVLRSDGGLGGYRWGLERKQRLLKQEAGQ